MRVAELMPSETRQIRVLVVDDHRTVADAVALAIEGESGLECVAKAHTVCEALALVEQLQPEVVVMDVRLSDGDGLAATAELTTRWPETRVVVLTAVVNNNVLDRAVSAGACALLPKDGTLSDLMRAVRTARRDDFMVHPSLVKQLMSPGGRGEFPQPTFTQREHEVLQRLAEGQDVVVIARALGISVLTCRGYIKSILVKLDAHTQLEAVVIAHRRGLVQVGDRH